MWIVKIKSDHGVEFQNEQFDQFYQNQSIQRQYATRKKPQQNGVVERKKHNLARNG